MNKDNTHSLWISAHIFYEEPFDKLIDEIQKFLKQHKIHINKFFFIRYFEGGPHIRLRLLPADIKAKVLIEKKLHAFFTSFLKRHPSKSPLQKKSPEHAETNSMHLVPYYPEIERYGGQEFMALAEECFMISSTTYFMIKKEFRASISEYKIQIAVFLCIALLYCFRLTVKQIIEINNRIFDYWIAAFYEANPGIHDARTYFKSELSDTGENIQSTVGELLACLEKSILPDKWLNHWVNENHKVASKYLKSITSIDFCTDRKYMSILPSFIHMMNNRLGIKNNEESYVSFIIVYALEGIEK